MWGPCNILFSYSNSKCAKCQLCPFCHYLTFSSTHLKNWNRRERWGEDKFFNDTFKKQVNNMKVIDKRQSTFPTHMTLYPNYFSNCTVVISLVVFGFSFFYARKYWDFNCTRYIEQIPFIQNIQLTPVRFNVHATFTLSGTIGIL